MFSLLFRVSSAHGPFAGSRLSGNVGFLGGSLESRTPSSVSLGLPFLYELALKGTKHPLKPPHIFASFQNNPQNPRTSTRKVTRQHEVDTGERSNRMLHRDFCRLPPPLTPPAPSQDSGDTCHLLKSRQSPVQFCAPLPCSTLPNHPAATPGRKTAKYPPYAPSKSALSASEKEAVSPPPPLSLDYSKHSQKLLENQDPNRPVLLRLRSALVQFRSRNHPPSASERSRRQQRKLP